MKVINSTKSIPQFGEIFITNDETHGSLECLHHFKGKIINSFGGGYRKLFVIEEGSQSEGVISSLHSPEYDQYDQTFSEQNEGLLNSNQIFEAFDNKGSVKKIVAGKKHMIFLTDEGKLYSYGYGEYGALGLGGISLSYKPQLLKSIQDKNIIQVSCGEFHSLALTQNLDVYSWGRGFEGQLGQHQDIQTSCSPKFLKHFYKNPISYITCGAYHSLAIDINGKLWCWGDNSLGQIGIGKKKQIRKPVQIEINPKAMSQEAEAENIQFEEQAEKKLIKINQNSKKFDTTENKKIQSVAAGYGHTVAITELGDIYSWGFNIKGQLGLGDKNSRYYPKQLLRDVLNNDLPSFKKVVCGYYSTYAICNEGRIYSWGGGNLGQKDEFLQLLPRRIEAHTEGRIFNDIFATVDSFLGFAQLRIISIRPFCGPSSGGTMVSLIGTGFTDTGKQRVRFKFGRYSMEVSCQFDSTTDCFHCISPKFDEAAEFNIQWPIEASVELSLDGEIYIQCEKEFLIYSSKIIASSIFPKCASVKGGTLLNLNIANMDNLTAQKLSDFTVGFQVKEIKKKDTKDYFDTCKDDKSSSYKQSQIHNFQRLTSGATTENQYNQQSPNQGIARILNDRDVKGKEKKGPLNPLDLSTNDLELDKENWICVNGNYDNGNFTCNVPSLTNYSQEFLQFNVDISLNGQQFSGQPSSFRFYDIQLKGIYPNNGICAGGTQISIEGKGLFDTAYKKIKFKAQSSERQIDLTWDKIRRIYQFFTPPISWLCGNQEPNEEIINQIKSKAVEIFLTLNGCEWEYVGNFIFYEPQIERFGIVPQQDKSLSQQQLQKIWTSEEISEDQIDQFADCKNDNDRKKREEELEKALEAEIFELENNFKKGGDYLYIIGQNFMNVDQIKAKFIYKEQAILAKQNVIYKNSQKLGVVIPEIEKEILDIIPGINDVIIEVSFNSQQYSSCYKSFRYLAFDINHDQQQKQKFEEEQLKLVKKPPTKK